MMGLRLLCEEKRAERDDGTEVTVRGEEGRAALGVENGVPASAELPSVLLLRRPQNIQFPFTRFKGDPTPVPASRSTPQAAFQ